MRSRIEAWRSPWSNMANLCSKRSINTSVRWVSDTLQRHQVQVTTSVRVERIAQVGAQLRVLGSQGFQATADLVLVAVGVQPRTELVKDTAIQLGQRNAIRITRAMETTVPDIFAAGDCAETWHRLLLNSPPTCHWVPPHISKVVWQVRMPSAVSYTLRAHLGRKW